MLHNRSISVKIINIHEANNATFLSNKNIVRHQTWLCVEITSYLFWIHFFSLHVTYTSRRWILSANVGHGWVHPQFVLHQIDLNGVQSETLPTVERSTALRQFRYDLHSSRKQFDLDYEVRLLSAPAERDFSPHVRRDNNESWTSSVVRADTEGQDG